ncbi:unnamed protein product [Ectocarpus sp. CCAP 1310/34]|nr:unnamed protein product [Ectocarpus sp. CCAP 1310/34]
MDTLERVQEQVRALEQQSRQERRWRRQQQQQQQQLGVFKVDEVVFPGMTKRFRIFEPRYRALVKQCLAEDEPLAILPLSRGGNTVATTARVSGLYNVEADGRCEVEMTGIARCSVKTMWMKGESFGLFEAEVELFGDEQAKAEEETEVNTGTAPEQPRDATVDAAGETFGQEETGGTDQVGRKGKGAGGDRGDGERLMAELPELERLRIEVSAIMQKELYRTRTRGRSPLWPSWDGSVSHGDAQAALTVTSPPLPTPLTIKTADDSVEAAASSSSGDCSNSAVDGGGGEYDTVDGNGGGEIGVGDKSSIGGLDPCDLDAEALSYWAAHNVEAGALMKHEWLSSTSTAARLRGVRDLCRFALARHRDRSTVDGGVLSRPLSALRDLTSR